MRKLLKFVCPPNVWAFQRPLWVFVADNKFHTSGQTFYPRFQNRQEVENTEPARKDDVKTLEEIEQNLFESPKHRSAKIPPDVLQLQKKEANKQTVKVKKTEPKAVPRVDSNDDYRFDETLGLKFRQLARHDKRLSSIMSQIRSKTDPKIQLEGVRLIDDALDAGLQLKTLLFSRFEQVHRIRNQLVVMEKAGSQHELIRIENSDMKLWSDLTTTPGVIGIFKKPTKPLAVDGTDLPITVICDQVREPNNLGGIIRVVASIPCQQVICVKGTADPWSAKSLRGGAGGHFRVSIKQMDWTQISSALPENSQFFIADNRVQQLKNCTYDRLELDGLDWNEQSEVKSHIVLVIGGETHGISREAMAYKPTCVNIPLAHRMESLNCCSAVSVILFEFRRKLLALQSQRHSESSDSDDENDRNVKQSR